MNDYLTIDEFFFLIFGLVIGVAIVYIDGIMIWCCCRLLCKKGRCRWFCCRGKRDDSSKTERSQRASSCETDKGNINLTFIPSEEGIEVSTKEEDTVGYLFLKKGLVPITLLFKMYNYDGYRLWEAGNAYIDDASGKRSLQKGNYSVFSIKTADTSKESIDKESIDK